VIALATGFAACGGSDNSDESPQVVVEEATFEGIESADLDLALSVKASGKEGGDVDVTLSGPFQGEGEGEIPQLDMDAKVKGAIQGDDVDFDGGLVLLPNSAYVNYEGTEYEVDPTTFSFVESALNQAQQQGDAEGESAASTACQEAAGKLDVASFADDLSNDGTADVGGTETTKLSGDLDVPGAIDALIDLSEDPACSAQLGAAGPLPSRSELEEAEDEVKRAVKTAHVDLYVGDDDIVRRLVIELEIAPQEESGQPQEVEVSLDLTLTGVNEEQEISAPAKAKPLSALFQKLDVNPLELLGALEGEGLGNLLEGFGAGGSSSGGGQSYSECIRNATSAVDLQRCASRL
jgi:hypothetical protein